MKPSEIHLWDMHRLLVGQAPWSFLIEVIIRGIITYVFLWAAMRLMGKRVAGQMSALELTIIVTLGAAIGVPLQAPDRGMIPAILILGVAIIYQRGLNFWAFKSRKAEVALQGDVSVIIREGCLELDEMRRTVLSRERLFSVLRQQGLVHLGQVKRAYLEADGHFSIYQMEEDSPAGLCLLPGQDRNQFEGQFKVDGKFACRSCGNVVSSDEEPGPCPKCHECIWTLAVATSQVNELRLPRTAKPQKGLKQDEGPG